jgi:hypothetical protein
LIPKANATEALVAHIVVAKIADGLPLFRQEKIFTRLGIDLPRATMANWMVQSAQCCAPLLDLLEVELKNGPLINIDETPLQVLQEPGRANTAKSFMWVYCGGPPDHPSVLYRYHPTRSGEVALKFLDDYQGSTGSKSRSARSNSCPIKLSSAVSTNRSLYWTNLKPGWTKPTL